MIRIYASGPLAFVGITLLKFIRDTAEKIRGHRIDMTDRKYTNFTLQHNQIFFDRENKEFFKEIYFSK